MFKLTDYKETYDKADITAFLVAHNQSEKMKLNRKPQDKFVLDFCGVTTNDAYMS